MDKTNTKIGNKNKVGKIIRSKWQLLLMFALPFAWYIIFCYVPMYGIQLGFRDYNPRLGIWEALLSGFGGSNSFFLLLLEGHYMEHVIYQLIFHYNWFPCADYFGGYH